jgi:hypothetical protein
MAKYTEEDLYLNPHTGPRPEDIKQDKIENCAFVATLAALAAQQPDRIRDAIRYDPESKQFQVTLYKELEDKSIEARTVAVDQGDIRKNVREQGGSVMDNIRGAEGPAWPAVMEAAMIELRLSAPREGKERGYDNLNATMVPTHALLALTGDPGQPLWFREINRDPQAAATQVEQALQAGRPVTYWSGSTNATGRPGAAQDGLKDDHVYALVGARRDASGDLLLQLRNPWGHNVVKPDEGMNTDAPTVEVNLRQQALTGGLMSLDIGPAPRVQRQQQDAPEPSTSVPAPTQLPDPRSTDHPNHSLYTQIKTGVVGIDTEKGRPFDELSERLAMGGFYDAKAARITSADTIAINDTGKPQKDGTQRAAGTLLFVLQGPDPFDPAAPRSITNVKDAIERPVEQWLQKIDTLTQQQTQQLALQPKLPTQDDPTPKSPKLPGPGLG